MSTATLGVTRAVSPTPSPKDILRQAFGFPDFRQGQEAVVTRLLAGRSVLAVFPTGAGKSLCYQLPALMLDGVTVVISPLIALMKDQIDFLTARGIAAARLDSTLELDEARRVTSDLIAGRLKLLYVAPERLANERFLQTLRQLNIAMLAVDEAHCISEWGHNFRPDYMKLAQLARELNVGRVLALTATATPEVAKDIARSFGIDEKDVVRTPFHRKNLVLRVTPLAGGDGAARNELLVERVRRRPAGPTIVYVTLQKTAEDVAEFLSRQGLESKAYHAGLEPEVRHQVQDWFMSSGRAIVVATIAFGMGIDKSDIRYVYHYNLPKSLENYAQEIGRAGRDGKSATCEMFAACGDRVVLENFTYGDTPGARAVGSLLADVLNGQEIGGDGQFDVSVYELSGKHDIRPLVVETILTYLELAGVIACTGPFYGEYKFQPLRGREQVLAKFDVKRREFLGALFDIAWRGVRWWTIDLKAAMKATGATRQRVVAALNYLEEQGHVRLQASGARLGYRLLKRDPDLNDLAKGLVAKFLERESNDVQRLERVLEFARDEGCRTRLLLKYFGEPLDGPCGHCDCCLKEREGGLVKGAPPAITPGEMNLVRALRSEKHPALATPRQMARYLCGINSPATARAKFDSGVKLRQDRRFGLLSDVPFAAVMDALTAKSAD